MILLLNLIPLAILLLAAYIFYVQKTLKSRCVVVIVTVLCLYVYMAARPSYLPKGEIQRTAVPAFEYKELAPKDLQKKPLSVEEREAMQQEEYEKPLPFLKSE